MKNGDSDKRGPEEKPECFVMMPLGEKDGYPAGHFGKIYEQIFSPACEQAGFKAKHAGEVRQTNFIHLDVLQSLLEAPMALCDLSTQNPNVLFELGIRQAFDKPVLLVQEVGTPKIFDIAPLRFTEYRRERVYEQVLEDQQRIAKALADTRDAKKDSINSIVRLLGLTHAAKIPEPSGAAKDPAFLLLHKEISALREEIRERRPVTLEKALTSPPRNFVVASARIEEVARLLDRGVISTAEATSALRDLRGEFEGADLRFESTIVLPIREQLENLAAKIREKERTMGPPVVNLY